MHVLGVTACIAWGVMLKPSFFNLAYLPVNKPINDPPLNAFLSSLEKIIVYQLRAESMCGGFLLKCLASEGVLSLYMTTLKSKTLKISSSSDHRHFKLEVVGPSIAADGPQFYESNGILQ